MDRIINLLRSKGFKITPQRRAVIGALQACGNFPTAQKILDHVKQSTPDVSLDTVYRNLSLLAELGAVNEIYTRSREGNVFEVLTDGSHHHHLICLDCGKTQCLDFCPVSSSDLERAAETGFQVLSHSLEFYGYCRECRRMG